MTSSYCVFLSNQQSKIQWLLIYLIFQRPSQIFFFSGVKEMSYVPAVECPKCKGSTHKNLWKSMAFVVDFTWLTVWNEVTGSVKFILCSFTFINEKEEQQIVKLMKLEVCCNLVNRKHCWDLETRPSYKKLIQTTNHYVHCWLHIESHIFSILHTTN